MSLASDSDDTPTAASTADLLALRERRSESSDTITCGFCDEETDEETAIRDSFCSFECFRRYKGRKALNAIESDHTLCATCFRVVKTVEKPPWGTELKVEGPRGRGDEDVKKDCLIGYQYPTEHMEKGLRDLKRAVVDDDSVDRRQVVAVPAALRWGCECGNTDPKNRDEILEAVDLEQTIVSLLGCLRTLAAEGTLNSPPSWPQLRDALRDHGRDWELVIGTALYG
ncbi:hypothetical protein C2R22_06045 [Salinigranum rubrum]|uniref:Uncharacterized protein n=1 Tax=Salinigranum rubrum TaxID=755307 RepID=A0A2I8VH89_9EURY|nr:hypothetical protein [Salinigranum rubrum]AUV81280.1 hypothetical protein C2R22_06045 [Salinigranum rubrum]